MYGKLTKYCYDSTTTKEWLEHLEKSHLCVGQLKTGEYENAICLPDDGLGCLNGGVVTSELVPIREAFQRAGLRYADKLVEKHRNQRLQYIDEEVVYLGQYRNHWGTFLIDSISRLWYAIDAPREYKYAFLATQKELGGIHPNSYEFLKLFGIEKDQILYIDKPTQFKKLIIPEMSYTPMKCWHPEYVQTIRKVVENSKCDTTDVYDKVYFSRSKFTNKSKTDFGEERIVELMRTNGFRIVYPEENTLEEQIHYANTCKVFASIGGSCAHNIIFAAKPPKMILFNRMNGYQWHQWMLDEMVGVEPITYVDAYSEPYKRIFKTTISGPYFISINKNVKKFIKDNGMKMPKRSLLRDVWIFVRYSLRVATSMLSKFKHSLSKMFKRNR